MCIDEGNDDEIIDAAVLVTLLLLEDTVLHFLSNSANTLLSRSNFSINSSKFRFEPCSEFDSSIVSFVSLNQYYRLLYIPLLPQLPTPPLRCVVIFSCLSAAELSVFSSVEYDELSIFVLCFADINGLFVSQLSNRFRLEVSARTEARLFSIRSSSVAKFDPLEALSMLLTDELYTIYHFILVVKKQCQFMVRIIMIILL